jgi:predicted nucleotidyltransferase
MDRLPEKIRRTLERLVNELKLDLNVYGVGLFGSWSRGDAAASSDVDLFILNKADVNHEYVERLETGGLFVDLDFVPRKWFHGPIPPEIDQKLYEIQILYDRDWLLANTKLLMVKSYCSPERVGIRTENHLLSSDIHLSRATSAFSRQDYSSAYIFAIVTLEDVLRILAEIALEPFSNSHFIELMERSTMKLEMYETFEEYLKISRLNEIDKQGVQNKLRLFKATWEEINLAARRSMQKSKSFHFKVKANLNYYLDSAFLLGLIMRTNSIIDYGGLTEAGHYLNNVFLDIAENYVLLKSSVENIKTDCTTLIRSLKNLEEKNPKNYSRIVDLLNLGNIEKTEAIDAIVEARKIALKIRKDRKVLIKNQLIKN